MFQPSPGKLLPGNYNMPMLVQQQPATTNPLPTSFTTPTPADNHINMVTNIDKNSNQNCENNKELLPAAANNNAVLPHDRHQLFWGSFSAYLDFIYCTSYVCNLDGSSSKTCISIQVFDQVSD